MKKILTIRTVRRAIAAQLFLFPVWVFAANGVADAPTAALYDNVNEGDYIIDTPGAGLGITIDEPFLNLQAGAKICIAGTDIVPRWSFISINMPNTMDSSRLVVITNYAGQVHWGQDNGSHVFFRVEYGNYRFKITGKYDSDNQTGDSRFLGHDGGYAHTYGTYGFWGDNEFVGTGQGAFAIDASSYEIEYAQVGNGFFAGFSLKRDNPGTGTYEPTTFSVHDCLIAFTESEGIYAGFNNNNSQNPLLDCTIYNNIFFLTGTEAIQIGNAGAGVRVYNNVIWCAASKWKHPFNRYQDNAVQFTARYGKARFENNIVMGSGEKLLSLYLEAGTGEVADNPLAGQDIIIQDNYFFGSRNYGVFMGNTASYDGVTDIRVLRNIWDGFDFTYQEVYPNETEQSYLFLTFESEYPVYLYNNQYENTKTFAYVQGNSPSDSSGNVSFSPGQIVKPNFVNLGWDVLPEQVEWWADTVGKGQSAFPTANTNKGDEIVYNLNDIVLKHNASNEPRFYQSLTASNTAIPVDDSSTASWALLSWDKGGSTVYVPPMDLRQSTYPAMGLLTSNHAVPGYVGGKPIKMMLGGKEVVRP